MVFLLAAVFGCEVEVVIRNSKGERPTWRDWLCCIFWTHALALIRDPPGLWPLPGWLSSQCHASVSGSPRGSPACASGQCWLSQLQASVHTHLVGIFELHHCRMTATQHVLLPVHYPLPQLSSITVFLSRDISHVTTPS